MTVTLELTREQLDLVEAALGAVTARDLGAALGIPSRDVLPLRGSVLLAIEAAHRVEATR